MNEEPERPRVPTGLIRVREHCTFAWSEPATKAPRLVEVLPSHCSECIAEIRRRGFRLTERSVGEQRG